MALEGLIVFLCSTADTTMKATAVASARQVSTMRQMSNWPCANLSMLTSWATAAAAGIGDEIWLVSRIAPWP